LGFATTVSLAASPTFERYFELPLAEAHQLILEEFDRTAINRVLEMEAGNITAAARRLGMHRQSLQQKMKQLGIR
jgi:ActR/RegA family two-component response regulator